MPDIRRQQVNIATAMKKLLLATTLLSVALSEDILTEEYPRQTAWINDKKPNGKTQHTLRDDVTSEFDEFSDYDDNKQLPRISDTRFISEPVKLPSIAVIRRPDATRFSQGTLLSSGKPKLGNTKPTVLISIGIQERTDVGGDTQKECSAKKKYRKHNQRWQLQQPFYVEEPQWIEIDSNYADGSSRSSESGDPYILSRGKKIFRIKDPGRLHKMIEDYEEILDFSSIGERLTTRNRVRRDVDETEAKSQNNMIDGKDNQEEETNHYNSFQDIDRGTNKIAMNMGNRDSKSSKTDEKSDGEETKKRKDNQPASSVHDSFIKKYEKDKLKNMARILPGERKFMERYRTSANDITITQEIQQENNPNKIETSNDETVKIDKRLYNRKNRFATDANKGNKRSAFFKNRRFIEDHKKRENLETEWKNSEGEKKVVINFEQMENNPYIDRMADLNTYGDIFILSRGKKPLDNRAENSNTKDTNKSIERRWKDSSTVERYRYRKSSESEENAKEENELGSDKDDIETGDTRLTDNSDSGSSGIKDRPNHREKRKAYKTKSELQRFKNMKKEISFSPYLNPRDKHSKIDERLLFPADPFFIIRGKKTSQEFKDNFYSMMEPRNEMNGADRTRATNLSTQEDLLRMLLAKRSSCNDRNYDISIGKLSKNKPRLRDRRGSLDNILNLETLKYDPFYVVRGKRMSAGNFQINGRSEQNQRSIASESDAA